jgi:hypothetical protein
VFEGLFQPIHLTVIAVLLFAMIVPYWQIFKKAGFSPWLSLLMLIPLVNVLALFYLAFAKWPVSSK